MKTGIIQTIPNPVCPNCHYGCNVRCDNCEQYISATAIGSSPELTPCGPRATIQTQIGGYPPKVTVWVWATLQKTIEPGYDPVTDYAFHANIIAELMDANPQAAEIAIKQYKYGLKP